MKNSIFDLYMRLKKNKKQKLLMVSLGHLVSLVVSDCAESPIHCVGVCMCKVCERTDGGGVEDNTSLALAHDQRFATWVPAAISFSKPPTWLVILGLVLGGTATTTVFSHSRTRPS